MPERHPDERGPIVRHGPALALGIVALALVLRAPGLLEWWLNPDEGIYYSILTQDRFSDFWAEAESTAHPPLYFLILRAVGWLTNDFLWLRAVALACGCAAVYGFIVVGRELGGGGALGWSTGLLAGLLLAVSPRAIVLSQVIRPYMLLLLLLSAAVALLLRYLRTPSRRILVAYGACTSVAVLLHYSSVFTLAVVAVIVAADGARRGAERPEWRRLLLAHLAPGATLGIMYVWHLSAFMDSVEAQNTLACCLMAFMIQGPGDVWPAIVGFHSTFAGDALAVPASLGTLAVTAYAAWRRAWTPLIALSVGLAVGVAGSLTQTYPFGPTRHSSWLLVLVLPALAWGVVSALAAGGRTRAITVAAALALLLAARPLASALDPEGRPRDISERVVQRGHLAAMQEVLSPEADPELILMSNETYLVLIPLYYRERQRFDESRDGLLHRFRWGRRHVIVMPDRDFTALPHQVGEPDHLRTALRAAEDEFGLTLPTGGAPVLVLSAGYESRGMTDLAELARRGGPLGTATTVPGVIALSLNVEAYLEALGEPGA